MPDFAHNLDDRAARPAVQGSAPVATCAVVLVAWNNREYLLPCLRSLYAAGLAHSFEVVVVDNGSTDGSQALLAAEFPDVLLIQNDRNVGLGQASNQGIAATTAPLVLLLNNDTLVNGSSIDAMIDWMLATPDAGAVGATMLNDDGSFQSGYNNFPTLVEEVLIATGIGRMLWPAYPSAAGSGRAVAVDWLTSACLLLRRDALDQVGPLDESYFIYGDETDIQYRLRRAGWRAYLVPDATIVHFGGRSLDRWRRRRMVYRGKMLFFAKNYGHARAVALRLILAALTAAKLGVWCAAWPFWRVRAQRELVSNVEVLRLCWKLE
jgi:GT2 family glycosyltransferase